MQWRGKISEVPLGRWRAHNSRLKIFRPVIPEIRVRRKIAGRT
jgi:hypothetical protein